MVGSGVLNFRNFLRPSLNPKNAANRVSQEMLPVCNIDGSYGDTKVAKKNNGGRNKQCKDVVVVQEASDGLLRGDQNTLLSRRILLLSLNR